MIRNMKILFIAASFLMYQPLGFAATEAGDHAGEEGQPRKVHLTPEQAELLALETVRAPKGRAGEIVSAPAEVRYVPERVAEVGPLLQGKITRLEVDLGDQVEKDQLMAELDSVDLAKIRSRLNSLEARKATAAAEYEREKRLRSDGISSEAEFLEAKANFLEVSADYASVREQLEVFGGKVSGSESSLAEYGLRSPIAGRIERMDVRVGQTLDASDTPFTVADTSVVWVMLQVAETDIDRVSVGDEVQVYSRSVSGRFHKGEVSWISAALDEATRTVPVRVVVKSPKKDLRPNTYAKARIITESDVSLPLVPDDAVQTIGDDNVVFVPGDEAGAYEAVTVTLGKEANGWIEIRSGITAGTEVVSLGAFDLMSTATASGRSADHN